MQRMSGLDASFLYSETPWLFTHTLKIAILDVPRGWTFDRARRAVREILPSLPAFCRRVVPVPLHLHHPVWVHDREPDLDWHLRHVVLPPPGDDRQLDRFVAAVAAEPLDRERPLWQVHVVGGLAGGRVAVVAKIHHALADGAAAAALLQAITSDIPRGRPELPPAETALERTPGPVRLVAGALVRRALDLLLVPSMAVLSVRRLVRWWMARRRAPVPPPLPFQAPVVSFDQPLSERRVFARTSVPLEAVRRVKDAWDVTVNDVVLALVAGSVRRYLLGRGEPADAPLVASVPVAANGGHLSGNRLSNHFVALPVHLEDPVDRLLAVRDATASVKQVHEHLGRDMMGRWLEFAIPAGLRLWWRVLARRWVPNPINLVVSNVRGPTETRWFGGSRVVELYSVGPVLERIGLNVTVWSYNDRLYAGVLSCPRNLPDVRVVAEGIAEELVTLSGTVTPVRQVPVVNADDASWRGTGVEFLFGETIQ